MVIGFRGRLNGSSALWFSRIPDVPVNYLRVEVPVELAADADRVNSNNCLADKANSGLSTQCINLSDFAP